MSWVVLILKALVALAFAVSGAAKLKNVPRMAAQFERFGFPPAWMYAVGVVELAGAVGLFLASDGVWASIGLALLLLGALVNHWKVGDPPAVWRPAAALLALCIVLALLISGQQGRF